jgi:hypothetical protein
MTRPNPIRHARLALSALVLTTTAAATTVELTQLQLQPA